MCLELVEGVQAAKGHGEGGERKRKRVNRSVQVGKEKKDTHIKHASLDRWIMMEGEENG